MEDGFSVCVGRDQCVEKGRVGPFFRVAGLQERLVLHEKVHEKK